MNFFEQLLGFVFGILMLLLRILLWFATGPMLEVIVILIVVHGYNQYQKAKAEEKAKAEAEEETRQ